MPAYRGAPSDVRCSNTNRAHACVKTRYGPATALRSMSVIPSRSATGASAWRSTVRLSAAARSTKRNPGSSRVLPNCRRLRQSAGTSPRLRCAGSRTP